MLAGAGTVPPVMLAATLLSFRAGADTGWWALLGLWLLLGAATSAVLTPSARLLRDASDEATRPYVFTAQFSLSHACFILTYPVAGWIGASAGLGWSAAVLTAVAALGAGLSRQQVGYRLARGALAGEDRGPPHSCSLPPDDDSGGHLNSRLQFLAQLVASRLNRRRGRGVWRRCLRRAAWTSFMWAVLYTALAMLLAWARHATLA